MLTILIATDHKPLREQLSTIILSQPLFRLTAVCADSHAALAIAGIEKPHIILIDGSTDPLAVIEATKKMASFSGTGIIAMSRSTDAAFAQHMLSAGALGYLTHASLPAEIIKAVLEVAKDNVYLCHALPEQQKQLPVATPPVKDWSLPKPWLAAARSKKRRFMGGINWLGLLRFSN